MTFRAKPVVKRAPKHSWESRDRRNFYLNLGFGLVVVVAIGILLIAVAASYYNENLAPVGSVDGASITKADLRDRAQIESWRLDESERRIRTMVVAGRLTQAQADTQNEIIGQQRQLGPIAPERIVDNRIQAGLRRSRACRSPTPTSTPASSSDDAGVPARLGDRVAPETDAGATGRCPPRSPPPRPRPMRR
jgi:hypothetical protein